MIPTSNISDHDSVHSDVTSDQSRQTASIETRQSAVELVTTPVDTRRAPDPERVSQKELFSPQMPSSSVTRRTPAATEIDRPPSGDNQRTRDGLSSDGHLSDGHSSDSHLSDRHSPVEVVASSRPPNPPTTAQQHGDGRRTLHLSLPNGNGPASGPAAPSPSHNGGNSGNPYDGRPVSRQGGSPAFAPQTRQPSAPRPSFAQPPAPTGPGFGAVGSLDLDQPKKGRESGAFIDRALRERIDEDIAAFLAAFDAALDHDTTESRTELREATDRLLRAGARTRIELERLEARVPLHPRDASPRPSPAFRPR